MKVFRPLLALSFSLASLGCESTPEATMPNIEATATTAPPPLLSGAGDAGGPLRPSQLSLRLQNRRLPPS